MSDNSSFDAVGGTALAFLIIITFGSVLLVMPLSAFALGVMVLMQGDIVGALPLIPLSFYIVWAFRKLFRKVVAEYRREKAFFAQMRMNAERRKRGEGQP